MLRWELGFCLERVQEPREYLKNAATCEVARNYFEMGLLPDYNKGKNYLQYEWMENRFWHYKTTLFVEMKEGFDAFLVFLGLDYEYEILINGASKIYGKGLFTPVKISLKDYENSTIELKVIFYPIPQKAGSMKGREEASLSTKPAVSYGWDFHPRLVPTGFYDDVFIEYKPANRIEDIIIDYFIEESLEEVYGLIKIQTNYKNEFLNIDIFDSEGTKVFNNRLSIKNENDINFTIKNPKLWWCRDHGKQELYTFSISICDQSGTIIDNQKKQIGFRKVRLLMNEGAWEGDDFPKTQGKVPITLELNGKKIFAKGTNLVPLEIYSSLANEEKYRSLLQLVYDCNMNIVRMWGGGIVNKESFFEICDNLGLMVWQEFPLSCNCYDDDIEYLSILDKESKSIIKRLKNHPCVVIWCGGNELFCSWGGMSNQSHAIRLLDKNCYDLDRFTPFMMTSPLYGMGHGHYMPINEQRGEVYSDIVHSDFTAYTEFGMPSPSPFAYLKTFMDEDDELYDMSRDSVWDHHHGVSAWDMVSPSWFCTGHIRQYFGEENSFEELIENGLLLQGEVYKNIYEEVRRKYPRASMALNWCFNEPWPCAANNSIVCYPDLPKPSYFFIKKALQNTLFSVRIEKMIWNIDEILKCDVFLLNDLQENGLDFSYSLSLCDLYDNSLSKTENTKANWCINQVTLLSSFEFQIKNHFPNKIKLIIEVNDIVSNEYLLFINLP